MAKYKFKQDYQAIYTTGLGGKPAIFKKDQVIEGEFFPVKKDNSPLAIGNQNPSSLNIGSPAVVDQRPEGIIITSPEGKALIKGETLVAQASVSIPSDKVYAVDSDTIATEAYFKVLKYQRQIHVGVATVVGASSGAGIAALLKKNIYWGAGIGAALTLGSLLLFMNGIKGLNNPTE